MSARRKKSTSAVVMFIAEYLPGEWPQLLATAADRDELESTHREWHEHYLKTCRELKAHGQDLRPVVIRMADFLVWCERNGCRNDASARARYAGQKGRELYAGGQAPTKP